MFHPISSRAKLTAESKYMLDTVSVNLFNKWTGEQTSRQVDKHDAERHIKANKDRNTAMPVQINTPSIKG